LLTVCHCIAYIVLMCC